MSVDAPLRVALVGAGRWAAVHRDALPRAGAELVGVATRSEASADRVRETWGVPATTRLAELLALGADAVIVASPNDLHAEHAIAALDAGLHVLVEKPMAITAADARAVRDAARARPELVVAVGHEMRTFTLFERVHALLGAGRIGDPIHLALALWRRPYRAGAGGWKSDVRRLGSTILEEPVHYLDLARWYLGDPAGVRAWATSRPGEEGAWQNLDVRLDVERPGARSAHALVTRSIAAYGHAVDLKLVGTTGALHAWWRGAMDLDPDPDVGLVLHGGGATEVLEQTRETGHAHDVWRQTNAFVRAIRDGTAPAAGADDGLAAVELCLAVERSLATGDRVALASTPDPARTGGR
ncbi:MAG: Gfo/Idh/MocA family oxidoreductase [Trueperaceae bacterium]|nr:Gfo/Idh/MocA family oxidoreductase [Trueperaceae bacterium]